MQENVTFYYFMGWSSRLKEQIDLREDPFGTEGVIQRDFRSQILTILAPKWTQLIYNAHDWELYTSAEIEKYGGQSHMHICEDCQFWVSWR
jgi:hypothetical protein